MNDTLLMVDAILRTLPGAETIFFPIYSKEKLLVLFVCFSFGKGKKCLEIAITYLSSSAWQ